MVTEKTQPANVDMFFEKIEKIRIEIKKRIKGYEREIDLVLVAVASFGHVLCTGYPGLAKTLLARTTAEVLGCAFKRIPLTPDLVPSDIRGTEIWRPDIQKFEVYKGPIFTNIVVADEINRGTPKVQSAFLDAMEERVVTIGTETILLPKPFMVFATRNPIEQEGVFPLPEAQLDRFLFEITFLYPNEEDEIDIARQGNKAMPEVQPQWDAEGLSALERFRARNVHVNEEIYKYIVKIVRTTRSYNPDLISLGASPRSTKMFVVASKAHALIVRKDTKVIPDDVDALVPYILKPRLIMNEQNWRPKNESDWNQLVEDIKSEARKKHVAI
jgi:MoxR-like ATPase